MAFATSCKLRFSTRLLSISRPARVDIAHQLVPALQSINGPLADSAVSRDKALVLLVEDQVFQIGELLLPISGYETKQNILRMQQPVVRNELCIGRDFVNACFLSSNYKQSLTKKHRFF